MYLLILFAFLHPVDSREHVVIGPFRTLQACEARASTMNAPEPFGEPRQPGDVFICARVVAPT